MEQKNDKGQWCNFNEIITGLNVVTHKQTGDNKQIMFALSMKVVVIHLYSHLYLIDQS